jgi:hypothetical protein
VSCRFHTSAAIPTGMVVGHTKMMTPKTSTPKVTRTAVVNEAMAIAAEILARKPDLEILNKVAAVNRGIELVAFYPCILDFRQYLTSPLDDLASLLESRDSTLAEKVRHIWVSADALETRVGMVVVCRG